MAENSDTYKLNLLKLIITLLVFVLFCPGIFIRTAYAQEPLLKKEMSISALNEKLVDVLDKIQKAALIQFSYNSKLIPKDVTVSVEAKNESIEAILDELFRDYNLEYRELNDQIIISRKKGVSSIFKKKSEVDKKDVSTSTGSTGIKKEAEPIESEHAKKLIPDSDTVITLQQDTIVEDKYDTATVFLYDTIVNYDTIQPPEAPGDTAMETFNWFAGISGSPIFPLMNSISATSAGFGEYAALIKDAETPLLSYTFGADLGFYFKKLTLQTGCAYTLFREKADYNISTFDVDTTFTWDITTQSYWITDTITSYYEIYGADTNWIYITDSSQFTTVDSVEISNYDTTVINNDYNGINTISYIEIPFVIGYNFILKKKFSCNVNGGIITGILINTKGKILAPDGNGFNDIDNKNHIKTSFSLLLGLGLNYKLNNYLSIILNAYYRQNLSSVYVNNYPVSKKCYSAGLKAGIRYRF
ncbi:MAG: STN domain-containing protein [Bacteroidota bacterium]